MRRYLAVHSDLRSALRQIVRYPTLSAAAILTLAIGMAVNAVAFTAVNAFLFKERTGWRVPGAGWIIDGGGKGPAGDTGVSPAEYDRLAAATSGALLSSVQGQMSLARRHAGVTETVWALFVSTAYFDIIEATPLAGRLFTTADSEAPVAVVSERFWRERLQSAAPGSATLTLNGLEVAVVGVVPESFAGPDGLYEPEIWLPYEARLALQLPVRYEAITANWLSMIGRLAPGVSVAEINVRLKAGADAIAREWPATHEGRTARFRLFKDKHPEVAAAAWIGAAGMALVGLVLLIACFNVANILLARAIERQREMGIRAAIGASRWRIVRLQLIEGLVIAALAGIAAAIITTWAQDLMSVFAIPIDMPQRLDLSIDYRVVIFIASMVLAAGILPALAPALRATKLNLVGALSAQGYSGSGRPSPGRQLLMVVQVAGSTAFLTVAALFVQSFLWTVNLDPGFDTERTLVLSLDPAALGYGADRAQLTVTRVVDRLRAIQGLEDVAIATRIPFYIGFSRLTDVEGVDKVDTYGVGANYFRTMSIPMLQGREFDDSPPTVNGVIVNEEFAQRWLASGNVIGRTIRLGAERQPRVIIGVSRQTVLRGFPERRPPAIYLPLSRDDFNSGVAVVARSHNDPAALAPAVNHAVGEIDPNLVPGTRTMREVLELPRWPFRSASLFFGVCGLVALLLATIGLVAVMSHAVNQRMREFGVRMAIGATRGQLLRDVMGSAMRVVAPGALLGIGAAMLLMRGFGSMLVGVKAADPATYAAITLLQATIALVACLGPARRAARVDPLTALRAD